MVEPAVFLSFMSLIVSLGSLAFAARAVARLSEQYTEFAQNHINGIRNEIAKKEKDQARVIDTLAKELAIANKADSRVDREISDLKQALHESNTKRAELAEEMAARLPPRRVGRPGQVARVAPTDAPRDASAARSA